MKSSRLRGAALSFFGLFLSSGTVYSQAPFSANPYGYPQPAYTQPTYTQPTYTQPTYSQPGYPQANYSAAPQSFYPLPPLSTPNFAPANSAAISSQPMAEPVNLAGPMNYATYSRNNLSTGPNSLVSDPMGSVLATPPVSVPTPESVAPSLPGPGQGYGQSNIGPQFQNQNYYYGYGQGPNGQNGSGPSCNGVGNAGAMGVWGNYSGASAYTNGGSGAGGCYDGSCGYAPSRPRWYAGVYGLWLTRDNYPNSTFSFDTANEAVQYTNSRDVNANWDGGVGITVGYCISGGGGCGDGCGDSCGCGGCALEFVYWGWFPDDVSTYTYDNQVNGNLNGIFNWNSLDYNGGNATLSVDNAAVHGLWRQTEVQNFEVNVLRFGGANYGPWQFSFVGGGRIFRYEDQLTFGADSTDVVFDGDATELFYNVQTVNKLYGFQIGGVGNYYATQRFVFNGGTKFGLFLNKIDHQSQIGGSQGLAVINNGPFAGQQWRVASNEEDVSFLGEVFLGGSYCLTPHWSLSAGYRAIAITGIATPTDQIYPDLRGINDVASIEANSSMILHGAYFGAQLIF